MFGVWDGQFRIIKHTKNHANNLKSLTCILPNPDGARQDPSTYLQKGCAPVPNKFILSVTTVAGLIPYPYSDASFRRISALVSGSK
jgi:hypothetical protein